MSVVTFTCHATSIRWHETVHGTAFKTKWKNRLLYNIASFMVDTDIDISFVCFRQLPDMTR